jgi:hypothetical protein
VVPFYAFPAEVRQILYATNAIEALKAKLRSAVRSRGHFPTDEAILKLLYLVFEQDREGVGHATARVGHGEGPVRRALWPALHARHGLTASFNRPDAHENPGHSRRARR